MGTPDNPRCTFVNAHIKGNELEDFLYFLLEFVDCFAWTYVEMLGLYPEIVIHKLHISKGIKPVKQDQQRAYRAPEPGSLQRSDLEDANWEVRDKYISPRNPRV